MKFFLSSKARLVLTIAAVFLLAMLVVAQEGAEEVQGEKWALIVGITDYQNVNDLQFAALDAKAMYELLTQQGGFHTQDDPHTTLLLDKEATKTAIINALERKLPRAKPNDWVLIYFSGHGSFVKDVDGDEDDEWDETLVPYDAMREDEGRMIIDDEFSYRIRRLRSKHVIIIIDACYSGGAGKSANVMGVKGEPTDAMVKDLFTTPEVTEGKLLMAASQPYQIAHERPDLTHGLFTNYLLPALKGKGDTNRDRIITAEEAFTYVKEQVKQYVEKEGLTSQTPILEGDKHLELIHIPCPRLIGTITTISENKKKAVQGDKVLIDLGETNGVQVGDRFKVYHEYPTGQKVTKELRGELEVEKVLSRNRSLCKVIKSRFPIEVGDKVQMLCPSIPPPDKSPVITSIKFPERIPADGSEIEGRIHFRDPNGDIVKARFEIIKGNRSAIQIRPNWEFNPQVEGVTEGDIEFSVSATHSKQQDVVLKVTLKDAEGNISKPYKLSFKISEKPDTPPVAKFNYKPAEPMVGEEVTFDASDSYDSGGEITSYEWDFDDGSKAQGKSVTHTYYSKGTYRVKLTVTDDGGLSNSTSKPITIKEKPNQPPVAEFTFSPSEPEENEEVTFDASESYDADGEITSYKWSFDDGTTDRGKEVMHSFSSDGAYQVELTVTDNRGAKASIEKEISVTKPEEAGKPTGLEVSEIVDKVRPAVVHITVGEGEASGFIISSDGYIITNYHVARAATKIQVKLQNGEEYSATPIAYHGGADLALLKIEARNLPTVELGSSGKVKVGDCVIVLGYPFGSFSVTTGILSATPEVEGRRSFQISSPVNPGNSGGPVLNEAGEVIGVVFAKADAAKYLAQYGVIPEGIAFSIPINAAKDRFKITKEGKPQIEKPPERGVLYEDDFSNPNSGWPSWESDTSAKKYEDGEYSILVKKENYYSWTLIPSPRIPQAFCLELKARKVSTSEGAYGVLFGYKDHDNHYFYAVSSYGNYSLSRKVEGKWATRVSWKDSYAVNKGKKANRLRIVIDASNNMKFYANGKPIKTVLMEPYYNGGMIALYAWGYEEDFQANFDYVKLMSLEECQ